MSDSAKARKMAERVKELTATAIRAHVKDPRLGMVTITDAKLSPDFREATIYFTVFGDEESHAASAAALDSAKGLLRSNVGRALGLRHSPSLTFVFDGLPEAVNQIDELLAKAADADAELHQLAARAQYAGDPNPYKEDAVEE
ncbi:MAG TPA: 30S ribosome-binding factor RbfA [Stackebrandtia sp.]|jgi:ribosome-binding factor A|uniref:30S ribosome-binding factor RbfA n=1 Tax=Stackebrandtia sp. TaxID=2023065 RepID=UPI002D4F1586|nr:30S ribosome-binding factor RbfA [Stackebrandtia sp.]HZE40214.1 30S ribosome-binding factor RbfA [Stackebrandtia sp.]